MRLNLHAKGILAFAALSCYVVVVAFVLGADRQKLLSITLELHDIHEQQGLLAKTADALSHTRLRLAAFFAKGEPVPSMGEDLALDIELVQSGLQALMERQPQVQSDITALNVHVRTLRGNFARTALAELGSRLEAVELRTEALGASLQKTQGIKWEEYHAVYDRMTLFGVMSMVLAATVFGVLVSLFFSRIAWDIGRVEERAADIVAGYRGQPLAVTRVDEIGGLMEAVNRMQRELRENERRLELSRQQQFHQEKMAAVGSLAAAVAHEINNPIAAIAGVARSMTASRAVAVGGGGAFDEDGPRLILEQAQRIATISRQVAEFTRPPSPRPELIDLNRLVQGVCKFMEYDRRLQRVGIAADLDPELPAVECVADHVTQVLMNLLINAGDALGGVTGRKPEIRVATRRVGDRVTLSVQDNGHGMDAATRERAFEEGFSTKAEGRGAGLGLFLCRTLIENAGGTVEIDSAPGVGTTVRVSLAVSLAATA